MCKDCAVSRRFHLLPDRCRARLKRKFAVLPEFSAVLPQNSAVLAEISMLHAPNHTYISEVCRPNVKILHIIRKNV